jgi:hypothetical protein
MSRNNRGSMEVELRNVDAADESLEPAEAIARELHLPELLAYVLQNRGFVADLRRDDATAFARAAEALSLIHRHDIARLSSPALLGCARGLSRTNAEVSATLYGAAAAFAEDWFFLPGFTRLLAATEERLRALLGDEAYTHCCETGRALSTRELVALTRAHAPSSSSNSSVVQPAGHERPRPFPPEKSERHASGPNTEK